MTAIKSNNEAEFCIFKMISFPHCNRCSPGSEMLHGYLGDGTAQDKMVRHPDGFHAECDTRTASLATVLINYQKRVQADTTN